MSWLLRALPLAFMVLGCAASSGPCLDWVEPGKTYTATLGSADVIPADASVLPERSCGTGIDLSEGDTISLHTLVPSSSPTCQLIKAGSTSSTIGSVTLGQTGDSGVTAIDPDVEAEYPRATVGASCRGQYRLGLNETDGVLRAYRHFLTDTAEACAAEGFNVDADNPFCWDSWLVEVKDSKGKVVATSSD
jgi:hypothetical protein